MKKSYLIKLIDKGYSFYKIANAANTSIGNVRYWLKKYDLKTNNKPYNKGGKYAHINKRYCSLCDSVKDVEDFYDNNGYCKICHSEYHSERIRRIKMIKYKGGECVDCKKTLFDFHPDVFDFHHRNPNEKDINFNRIKYKKWEFIKGEIDKCDLICTNCHRTLEAEIREGKKYEYDSKFVDSC